MEMMPEHMGYDRAIVVFSPDGRLFQVEYAKETVKKAPTAVGIVFKDGVLLLAQKRTSKIVSYAEKIFQLDKHLGAVYAGLVADARVLVDIARVKCQQNKIVYGEPCSVNTIGKFVADRQQVYTQHAGARPFGVSLLIGGMDGEPKLYETDPSGRLLECKARCLGTLAEKMNKLFESKYRDHMSMDEALKLAVSGLVKEGKLKPEEISTSVIDKNGFRLLETKDLKKMGA